VALDADMLPKPRAKAVHKAPVNSSPTLRRPLARTMVLPIGRIVVSPNLFDGTFCGQETRLLWTTQWQGPIGRVSMISKSQSSWPVSEAGRR
jgi:hypothetical protein